MQHVKKEWLTVYNWLLVALDTLFFAAYILFNSNGRDPAQYEHWGITPLILVVAAMHAAYVLFIFPFVRKKSEWTGNFISFALFIFLFAAIIETSQYSNLWIRFGYAFFVFSTALIGPFVPIATIVATWVFFLYTLLSVLQSTGLSLRFEFAMNVVVTILGISGWLILKRFYIKKKDRETIALSRMLEQEQFKSNVMLESITDGVMIINTHGTVQVLNRSAADMLGWNQSEALKLDYRSLLKIAVHSIGNRERDRETAIAVTFANQQPAQAVSLLKTKNNRQIFIDIVASPLFEETSPTDGTDKSSRLVGVIAVLRNVDDQKRQEQQRSDFISTASHEMRTPVASIQGFIELALNPKVATVDDKAREYLNKAHKATVHLGELFQDLLTVSKSDDGRLSNHPEVIEVNELLQKIIEEHKASAENKNLKVTFESTNNLNKTVAPLMYINADPERLREVVINLFDNAVKYTQNGMITIGVSLKEQSVVIRISDTGMGIAEEDIPHLFQKFYRTDNTATREIGGTGLGLYICKQIIELMNGKIWVESTVGAGSTFYVEVPRVDISQINTINKDNQQP